MELYIFIQELDNFLKGKINLETFIRKLETFEELLLDMEELLKDTEPVKRDVILKILDVLDNISIFIEESDLSDKNELREDLQKLIKLEGLYKNTGGFALKKPEVQDTWKTEKFMMAKPGFEAHPGMKSKLPLQHTVNLKSVNSFINDINAFSQGDINLDSLLDKIELIEEDLLDMEEFAKVNNPEARKNVLDALEILDNVKLIVDTSRGLDKKKLDLELDRWLELEKSLHNINKPVSQDFQKKDPGVQKLKSTFQQIPLKPPGIALQSPDGKLSALPGKNSLQNLTKKEFIFSRPEFESHPGMKARLPVQVSELIDKDDIESKSSPFYNFLNVSKKYLEDEIILSKFMEVLEVTDKEVLELKKEMEEQLMEDEDNSTQVIDFTGILKDDYLEIEDEEKDENIQEAEEYRQSRIKMIKILEDMQDTFSYMLQTLKKQNYIDDLNLLIEDIEDLNRDYLALRKEIFISYEVDEEEELIKIIIEMISEEDFITSNYLLVKDSALDFLNEQIPEEEFVKVLDYMSETIREAKEDYEDDHMAIDGWTLESLVGDKVLRKGIDEWKTALDFLYKYRSSKDPKDIHSGIEKIYEANKKLIINQKLEEYINEQIDLRNEYVFS